LLEGYVAASYGVPMAFNDDTEGFGPARYAALGVLVRSSPVRDRMMMLGAAGVSHIVTFEALDTPHAEPVAELTGVADRPQRVYRNRLVLPRARIVATVFPYAGEGGWMDAVRTGPDDLFARAALVEVSELARAGISLPGAPTAAGSSDRSAATAEIVEGGGGSLRIVTRGGGGYLVLSDTWVPGWKATLDGRDVPVIRADFAFRAVKVPPGEHEVRMDYRPW